MKKVIRLNENDIEKLVKKIIREEDSQPKPTQPKKEEEVIKQTNNGALSAIDTLIKAVSDAKDGYTELCNSKITGSNGHLDSIDGLATKFTSLISSLEKSKEKIANIVVQRTKQAQTDNMRQRKMDYMANRENARQSGRYYS
jgi:hypothetical protein